MRRGLRIAVVIPAYNVAELITKTLGSVPAYVDDIYLVDDGSRDGTHEAAERVTDARLRILRHASNRGVGAAIAAGYCRALADGADIVAVMAGDQQMAPEDLTRVLAPIEQGMADYVKGNRFIHPEIGNMPLQRRIAGKVLGFATRALTGLAIDDPQCGYTALAAQAARRLPLEELWPRYGYPNDLLALTAAHGLRVSEVPVRPIYRGERSGVRAWHVLVILGLLVRRRYQRRKSRAAPRN